MATFFLVLGCKDFPPFEYSKDVGGIEVFVNQVVKEMKDIEFFIFSRRYPNSPKEERKDNIEIYRTNFINTQLLRTPSFNFFSYHEKNSYFIIVLLSY